MGCICAREWCGICMEVTSGRLRCCGDGEAMLPLPCESGCMIKVYLDKGGYSGNVW